jgi:hypothetical protein
MKDTYWNLVRYDVQKKQHWVTIRSTREQTKFEETYGGETSVRELPEKVTFKTMKNEQ